MAGLLTALPQAISDLLSDPVIQQRLPADTVATLLMVGWATLFTAALGLPLGLVLHTTGPGGLTPAPRLNAVLGLAVNIGRSLPFVILMIAVGPLTALLVGTRLGWQAAIPPLAIAAVPFYARLVEAAAREVDPGKVEAARVMGSTRRTIVVQVLLRESLPALVAGLTTTVIALISYSAMAGALGAGGLGFLAVTYGWSRNEVPVMVACVVVIVVIVQVVQAVGDAVARRLDHR